MFVYFSAFKGVDCRFNVDEDVSGRIWYTIRIWEYEHWISTTAFYSKFYCKLCVCLENDALHIMIHTCLPWCCAPLITVSVADTVLLCIFRIPATSCLLFFRTPPTLNFWSKSDALRNQFVYFSKDSFFVWYRWVVICSYEYICIYM